MPVRIFRPVLDPGNELTPGEVRTLRALKNPNGIQRFLDSLPYNHAHSFWSPRRVLRERKAHCLEGAILAAAALRALGYPPLVFDLEAEQDTDHVVAVYRVGGHWGAIAKSNFAGCRDRAPVYRSLRELALSYFHIYFNLRGERTLRRYSRPVNLTRFDRQNWTTAEGGIEFVAEHLCDIPHRPLLPRKLLKNIYRVDARTREGEMVGHAQKPARPVSRKRTAAADRGGVSGGEKATRRARSLLR